MSLPHHPVLAAVALAAIVVGCGSDDNAEPNSDSYAVEQAPTVLLDAATETILGQPIDYPAGMAQVSSSVIVIEAGEETGWHHHEAPLLAYILDGSVTVDYGDDGERTYEQGEAIIEAIGTSHNARSSSDDSAVRILVVNIGADGAVNTAAD